MLIERDDKVGVQQLKVVHREVAILRLVAGELQVDVLKGQKGLLEGGRGNLCVNLSKNTASTDLLANGRLQVGGVLHHRPIVLHLNGSPLLQVGDQVLRVLRPHLRLLQGDVHALGVEEQTVFRLQRLLLLTLVHHLQTGGRVDGAPAVLRRRRGLTAVVVVAVRCHCR